MQLSTEELVTILRRNIIFSCILIIVTLISISCDNTKVVLQKSCFKDYAIFPLKEEFTVEVSIKPLATTPNVKEVKILKNEEIPGEYFLDSTSAMEYTEDDVTLLATLIFAEAGICDEMEKYRVGNVVLNRVNDTTGEFNNSIESVIYQDGQFTSVGGKNWQHGPTEEEISIATDLLEGKRVFPEYVVWFSKKCNYGQSYYNSKWHEFSGWKVQEEDNTNSIQ